MNSKYPVSYQPIRDIQFKGLHLIEASAGTGKTYTLSSLMVRIFLEKYLPNQVIATTFTRAAAAELKAVSVCVWWRFSSIWNRYAAYWKLIFTCRRSRKLIH